MTEKTKPSKTSSQTAQTNPDTQVVAQPGLPGFNLTLRVPAMQNSEGDRSVQLVLARDDDGIE